MVEVSQQTTLARCNTLNICRQELTEHRTASVRLNIVRSRKTFALLGTIKQVLMHTMVGAPERGISNRRIIFIHISRGERPQNNTFAAAF